MSIPAFPSSQLGGPFGSAYTIEAWVNPYTGISTTTARIFDTGSLTGDRIYFSYTSSGYLYVLYSNTAATTIFTAQSVSYLAVNTWHHVAVTVTWQGGAGSIHPYVTIYIDGLVDYMSDQTAVTTFAAAGPPDVGRAYATIGRAYDSAAAANMWKGALAEVVRGVGGAFPDRRGYRLTNPS